MDRPIASHARRPGDADLGLLVSRPLRWHALALGSPGAAPVAQLDRVLPSEGRGHRFESCRVRQYHFEMITFFFITVGPACALRCTGNTRVTPRSPSDPRRPAAELACSLATCPQLVTRRSVSIIQNAIRMVGLAPIKRSRSFSRLRRAVSTPMPTKWRDVR